MQRNVSEFKPRPVRHKTLMLQTTYNVQRTNVCAKFSYHLTDSKEIHSVKERKEKKIGNKQNM